MKQENSNDVTHYVFNYGLQFDQENPLPFYKFVFDEKSKRWIATKITGPFELIPVSEETIE
jgi:hypothetical protein